MLDGQLLLLICGRKSIAGEMGEAEDLNENLNVKERKV
jgi:hypothetical protein